MVRDNRNNKLAGSRQAAKQQAIRESGEVSEEDEQEEWSRQAERQTDRHAHSRISGTVESYRPGRKEQSSWDLLLG